MKKLVMKFLEEQGFFSELEKINELGSIVIEPSEKAEKDAVFVDNMNDLEKKLFTVSQTTKSGILSTLCNDVMWSSINSRCKNNPPSDFLVIRKGFKIVEFDIAKEYQSD